MKNNLTKKSELLIFFNLSEFKNYMKFKQNFKIKFDNFGL